MAKVRKGATIVLKLDELFLWVRKQNQPKNKSKNNTTIFENNNGHINNGNNKNTNPRFKIVNRPLDFNKLPPCRAKIIYMGIPKFLKAKKIIFGVQLYPPYFGLSKRIYKSINTRKILGKIPNKEFKVPIGSIWFITEKDIKGIMLRNTPRRMSKGATHMTKHLASPNINNSSHSQNHIKHLNLRSSSKSPKFIDEKNDNNDNKNNEMFSENNNKSNDRNNIQKHFRRRSSFSMSCHYKNLSSLDNITDLESLFWEDKHLPSDYNLHSQSDPKERRFKLDRWLYPIFLDFHDTQTTEIVKDRCQWELTQWIRDESEGVRTPLLRQFYDYMVSLSDNLDAIFLANTNKYINNEIHNDNDNKELDNEYNNSDSEDEVKEYLDRERIKKQQDKKQFELWESDEINFEFEMMTRIMELTECVEDTIEAKFVLDVIDALDNDVFLAAPVLQCIMKFLGNDIKFMCSLYDNCSDKNARDKIINVYNNNDNRLLLIVWELVEITGGNEEMIEKILVNTDNLSETDTEILSIGVLEGVNNNLDMCIKVFKVVLNYICDLNNSNGYIYKHVFKIIKLCKKDIGNGLECAQMIRFGIGHALIPPYELFMNCKENINEEIILQLNILSSLQIKYERYGLFLGRYLLYCPFKTKALYSGKGKYDNYKKDQDEIEFYDENDMSDNDNDDDTALLFELRLDIKHFGNKQMRQLIIRKCLCIKNFETLEYEPDHYYDDDIIYKWDIKNYNDKILLLNNTPTKWIPNLNNISKINPSFSSIEFNPEDLSNELRGYLVLLTDENGTYNFINDLFNKWNGDDNNKGNQSNKYIEAMHKMSERPLFVSMEKWKVTDNH